MANSEHIAIIQKGVDAWNQWRKDNPSIKPDLSGADFTTNIACNADSDKLLNFRIGGSRIYTHDLPKITRILSVLAEKRGLYKWYYRIKYWCQGIFTKQNLIEDYGPSIEYSSYMRGIDLSNSNLENANFEAVYLPEANLGSSICDKAHFKNADLRNAVLNNTRLCNANLSSTDLEGAQLRSSNPYNAQFQRSILRGADLNNIIANEADFRGADFGYSSCRPIDFEKEDLLTFQSKRTCINGALLSKACFDNANMRDVEMNRSVLNGASFVKADLSGSQLIGSSLKSADLTGVNLRNAVLENANVFDVVFDRSGKYRGIRLDGCYGSRWFARFARDQDYLEELQERSISGKMLYTIWLVLADCGRTPWRWLLWSLFSIFCFGVLFANYELPNWLGWLPESMKKVLFDMRPILDGADRTLFTPYYFSIVTFTTLGFGDVTPLNLAGEIWVSLEVIFGYVMLGGLISILATIIARRAD